MPVVKGFLPSQNGLHFANNFDRCEDIPLEFDVLGITVRGGRAANGMCGGMIFYVRDLFEAGFLPLPDTAGPCNGPLFETISRRLFDSFDLPDGPFRYMALIDPHTPDCESPSRSFFSSLLFPHGRPWIMIKDEWPKIQADIDAGCLSPIGVILEKSPRSTADINLLSHQHQVLVYGYDLEGDALSLRIYDPNQPDHDHVTLSLDVGDPTRPTPASLDCADCGSSRPVYCFFRTGYHFHPPTVHGEPILAP
jgi:hypothetical protein